MVISQVVASTNSIYHIDNNNGNGNEDNYMEEGETESGEEWLHIFLEKQYCNVEIYCNAQTRLQNSFLEKKDEGTTSSFQQWNTHHHRPTKDQRQLFLVKELSRAIENVQNDSEALQNYFYRKKNNEIDTTSIRKIHQELNRKEMILLELIKNHLDLSERVLYTIYEHGGMYHLNGLPATKDDLEIKTVALAILRASKGQIQNKLLSP
mmetsp:Transcript_36975/g.42173  ORF Transcript_36975/g.42173 Transcript_36975/m.42173 type:complete len:208 (+) Transcript_36975:3-626(+)